MEKRFAVAVVLFASPAGDIVGCASCVDSLNKTMIAESEKYGPGPPDVPSARVAKAPVKPKPRGRVRVALKNGDVVEEDEAGHVTAIRHATTPATWTRFKPGAVSPAGEDWVEGELK
jgi:hypothetical protein